MKILIVSQFFVLKSSNGIFIPGGTERYTYGLAKQLKNDGHNVVVLSATKDKNEVGHNLINGIRIYNFKTSETYYRYVIDFLSFFNTLKNIKKFEPEIVHVHSNTYFFGFGAVLASKIMRKKTVFTCHSPPKLNPPTLLHKFYNYIASKFIGSVDAIVSPSIDVTRILAFQINHKKIVVIPNFISRSYYKKTAKEKDSILFVGRLYIKQKGIHLLIRALYYVKKEIPNIKLYIVGEGHSLDYLKTLVAEYKLEKNVIFWGHASDDELVSLYSKCEIFIMPSLCESFGIVIIEAMSSGLPIISYNLDCICEILEDGKYGVLVKKGEVIDLAEEIIKLLKNDELRLHYSKMSVKRSKRYSQTQIVREIEKIYLNILDG